MFLTVYSVAMIGGAAVEGRGWVRRADGFAVLFTKLAAMSPIHRDDDGRLRLRSPLAGLSTLPDIPATVPFILVVLGSTTFDGFTRSSVWLDIETQYETGGLSVDMTHMYGFDGTDAPANTLGVTYGLRGEAYQRMKDCGLKGRL